MQDASPGFPPQTKERALALPDYPHWGAIMVEGADAARFLHSQLTADVLHLKPDTPWLMGYCAPNGRLLASFIALKLTETKDHQGICLICRSDIVASTMERLRRFVLRSKVHLSAQHHDKPQMNEEEIRLQQLREVHSGVCHITSVLAERFVPQMLNYESIGGINFQKGCYPGQEVVARSQFRGGVKRRTAILAIETDVPIAPLSTVCAGDLNDTGAAGQEEVGQVLQAVPAHSGETHALVCLQEAASRRPLRIALPQTSAPARMLELPYPLRTDI